jgi:sec-independent protein translocase protein TatC
MCVLYELGIWSARLFIRVTKAPEEEKAAAAKES